nr:hypothetical protein CFP56_24850 [Quercus suber]
MFMSIWVQRFQYFPFLASLSRTKSKVKKERTHKAKLYGTLPGPGLRPALCMVMNVIPRLHALCPLFHCSS